MKSFATGSNMAVEEHCNADGAFESETLVGATRTDKVISATDNRHLVPSGLRRVQLIQSSHLVLRC